MTSQGGAYVADPGGTAGFRSPDQSRHGWGGPSSGDFTPRGGSSAYGVTPSLSGTSGHGGGGNGLPERAPGSSPPPTEPSRPLAQILNLTTFEIGDERWPRSRELLRAGDEARPNEGEDSAPRPPPSLWTGEDAARLVAALNDVQLKARERAGVLTSCLNKLDRWQNQVANRKRKKEMQQTGASGGSLSSGNAGSGAPLGGGDASRGTAPGPAKKLRTSLVDVGAARPAKGNWGSPPAGRDSPRGVTNSANTESEEAGELEWDGNRSKKKRTRKSDANGDVSWHEEPSRAVGNKGESKTGKVGKVWLGKSSPGGGGLKGLEKGVGGGGVPSKKRFAESPSKYVAHGEGQGWPRGGVEREEKLLPPGKERPLEREGGVAKGMRGPRTGVGGPNAAHLIRLKSFTSEGRNQEMGQTPRGVVKKPPPSGPVGGERKKSPLGGEKKRAASRSPSPSPGYKNPNKVARLARTNSAALKMLRDEYIYTAEKPFAWGKEKKGANAKAPPTGGDWRKSPKGGVLLKVEKEGLVIEAPDGAHISVLKKSHKKGGSAQYRKEMAAIANRFMLDRNAGFDMGAIREDEGGAGESTPKKKNFARGGTVKRGGRSSRLGRQFNTGPADSFEPPSSRNGDATPSSTEHDGFNRGLESGLDSWGKRKRTTRQGPDRAAKKVFVGGLQDDSEAESDEEMENELVVAFETLPQTLQERLSSDFWREVEPYFAFLREEDLAFLRENFRELKEGDVVLSVPRCGEHFRKLWANEDQAGRFLLDDNPKTPGPDCEEPPAAEAWLQKAGKVSLSQRLLAALIDVEEQIEGEQVEKQAALALPPAVDPPNPTSPPIREPQTHEDAADKDPLRSNGPSDGGPIDTVEEPCTLMQEETPAEKGVGSGGNFGVSEESASAIPGLPEVLTGAGNVRGGTGAAESAAADSRGFDDRIQRSAEPGVEASAIVAERGGTADPPETVQDHVAIVLESDDEDMDIVNVVEGGVEEKAKGPEGAPERSAWEQKFDAMTLDERIQWELQNIGLVDGKEEEPEAREDDPVCFELRSLQRQLREQLDEDNARLGALEQRAAAERPNEEREREKWALFQFLEKLYERRKGARAGLGPGSSKGGKGAAQKKVAAKEAFLASARRALRKVAEFEAGASVVPRGLNRKWEEKARAPALEDEEPAATPTDAARRGRNSAGGAPLAVKDDRKARQVAGEYAVQELPVVASKGQRTRKKPVNKGKRKTPFGEVLGGANGTFGGEKELDLERMREREADILAEAQAAAAAEAAAARAEAEQQAAALNMGPSNFEDMTMDLSALPLPDFAGLGDDAFGGGFDMDFGLGADQFNELAELDKIGLDDLGDMGF